MRVVSETPQAAPVAERAGPGRGLLVRTTGLPRAVAAMCGPGTAWLGAESGGEPEGKAQTGRLPGFLERLGPGLEPLTGMPHSFLV